MDDFFATVDLGLNHVQVILRGMYAVARADLVHQAELIMLREFYDGCRQQVEGLADFQDVIAQDFDAATAAEILSTPELRRVLIRSCLLLAFADGVYSAAEKAVVGQIARELDLSAEQLDQLEEEVRDHLLQQISRIGNLEALQHVAKELRSS